MRCVKSLSNSPPTGNIAKPFRTAGVFRTGSDPRSLYRAFFQGRDGTPMPSFGEFFDEEDDRWGLVWYVKSLSDPDLRKFTEK